MNTRKIIGYGLTAIMLVLAIIACNINTSVTYTVTFNTNEATSGTAPAAQTASSGSSITIPYDYGLIIKTGCTFGGWNTNAEGTGTTYAAGSSYTVTANVTLYAKWDVSYAPATVTFNANGATSGTAPAAQTVSSGSTITLPDGYGLAKTGYTFGGWNTNAEGTGPTYASSFYTVTGNVTLYAKWNAYGTTTFNVTFYSQGADTGQVPTQVITSGGHAVEPQNVSRSGHTLAGWFRDSYTYQTQWNFATDIVTQDIWLYAKWDVVIPSYTVTFDSGDGTPVPAQTVVRGGHAAEPQGVTRVGYTLAGWFRDRFPLRNQWNFATDTVTQNITLYAGWNINQYRVTFDSRGGAYTPPQTVNYGQSPAEPQGVTRVDYTLEGWYTDDITFQNKWVFGLGAVTQNITLYARWILGVEMVSVPGGTFQMGKALGIIIGGINNQSPDTDDTAPVSSVTLTGFYMGKYEVTQKQWQMVMGTTMQQHQQQNTSNSGDYGRGNNYPIYFVNWYEALVFCNKLSMIENLTPAYRISNSTNPDDWGTMPTDWDSPNIATWNAVTIDSGSTGYRLPTEAQWEYAAKGGNPLAAEWVGYRYAGSDNPYDVAWYNYESFAPSTSQIVGRKAPNRLGLYDMTGNVWEWCWDRGGSYTSDDKTDPTGASSGSNRVIRGGYWGASVIRSVDRGGNSPYNRLFGYNTGFRLVRPMNY
jgi:uncharacterized repeat protein (TIGR02543 family)